MDDSASPFPLMTTLNSPLFLYYDMFQHGRQQDLCFKTISSVYKKFYIKHCVVNKGRMWGTFHIQYEESRAKSMQIYNLATKIKQPKFLIRASGFGSWSELDVKVLINIQAE